jgi:chemotaxis signal transduction protein
MSVTTSEREAFVVFPLGTRRFALSTTEVVELSRTGKVQTFPQTTAGLDGVLVRRGEILPVWDLAIRLGTGNVAQRFWLVTRRNFAGEEPTAIPVSGECQLLRAEMAESPEGAANYVRGVLALDGQSVEVLDLARLAIPGAPGKPQERAPEAQEA